MRRIPSSISLGTGVVAVLLSLVTATTASALLVAHAPRRTVVKHVPAPADTTSSTNPPVPRSNTQEVLLPDGTYVTGVKVPWPPPPGTPGSGIEKISQEQTREIERLDAQIKKKLARKP